MVPIILVGLIIATVVAVANAVVKRGSDFADDVVAGILVLILVYLLLFGGKI